MAFANSSRATQPASLRSAWLSILLAAISVAPTIARAQSVKSPLATLKQAGDSLADLIERVEPALVAISHQRRFNTNRRNGINNDPFGRLRVNENAAATPSGAGVVISKQGLILTQYLAIQPGSPHFVTTVEGKRLPAIIKAADPRSGLAVLEVQDKTLTAVPIGKAENLRKGNYVLTSSNPFGIISDGQPTSSLGSITSIGARLGDDVNLNNTQIEAGGELSYRTTLQHLGALIQTDARLGLNSTGGALFNLDGELVGILTTASTIAGHEQPAGYAIPLNSSFRRIVTVLTEGKEVEYGFLGIGLQDPRTSRRTTGVGVGETFPGLAAAQGGLLRGDIIQSINGKLIPDIYALQLAIGTSAPGVETEVSYLRDGQQQQTTIKLSKYFVPGVKIFRQKSPAWRGIRVDYSSALPSELLNQYSAEGKIDPEGCVLVKEVEPNSSSWKSGVRAGMFISHVGEQRVKSPDEFWRAVNQTKSSLKLRFTRSSNDS